MRPCLVFLSACSLLIGFWIDGANAQVELKFDFEPGRVDQYQTDEIVRQSLRVFGTELTTQIEQSMVLRREAAQRDEMARIPLQYSVESLTHKLSKDGVVRFSFDSSQPDGEDPLKELARFRKFLTAKSNSQWTTTIDPEHQVVTVDDFDNLLQQLDEEHAHSLAPLFDLNYVMGVEAAKFHSIPIEAIEPGFEWTADEELRVASGQSIHLERRYTYAGTEVIDGRELHSIDISVEQAKWEIDRELFGERAIKPAELEVINGSGRLMFDATAGCIESRKESISLKGELEFEISDREARAVIDLEIEINERRLETEGG